MNHQPKRPRNIGLDLLRIIAMVIVLWVHTSVYARIPSNFLVRNTIGPFAVELFFVMSGYLYGRGFFKAPEQFSVKKFYIGRVLRILPVYFLALVFTSYVSGDPLQPICFFLLQNYDEAALGFLPTAWSLCVEEWSYVILTVVYVVQAYISRNFIKQNSEGQAENFEENTENTENIVSKKNKQHMLARNAMLAACICIILLALIVRLTLILKTPALDWDFGLRKQTLPRMDVFAYGILAAYIEKEKPQIYKKVLVSKWGVLAMLFCCGFGAYAAYKFIMGAQNGLAKMGYFTILPIGVLLLMLLVKDWELLKRPAVQKTAPVVTFLSALTYPLYLVHFPLYIHYSDICHRAEILNRGPMIAKTIVICVLIAAAVHVVVEIPLEKLKRILTNKAC